MGVFLFLQRLLDNRLFGEVCHLALQEYVDEVGILVGRRDPEVYRGGRQIRGLDRDPVVGGVYRCGRAGRELRLHEIRHDVAFVIDGDPDHKVNRIGFQLGSRQLEVAFLAKCHYGLIGRESVGVIQLYDFGKGALQLGGRIHALLRDFALFEVVAVIILLLVAGQHVDRYARAVYLRAEVERHVGGLHRLGAELLDAYPCGDLAVEIHAGYQHEGFRAGQQARDLFAAEIAGL